MIEMTCDPSASVFPSAPVIWRGSDRESLLDFPGPASVGPSDDNVNVGSPDDDPINRRIAGMSAAAEDIVGLYVKVPTGWSNLQLGPNLQIP